MLSEGFFLVAMSVADFIVLLIRQPFNDKFCKEIEVNLCKVVVLGQDSEEVGADMAPTCE
jgi:hypothetical protein